MAEIVCARAALLVVMLWSLPVHAAAVKIPEGQPMGPNPVAAQSKPVEKHAAFAGVDRTWHDVYRNDIYYVSERPADLSAQTIAYSDRRLSGGR